MASQPRTGLHPCSPCVRVNVGGCAQVPAVVRMAKAAVASGKCVVIGLQSTGEARTADVVAERGEELDDFVSGECMEGVVDF